MLGLGYSLVIEATADPLFFSFYSPAIEGFSGTGSSVEDCIYKARWGMIEHIEVLKEQGLPVPDPKASPTIMVRDATTSAAA
jgi:predicted RNase H-like HicB family nuclease